MRMEQSHEQRPHPGIPGHSARREFERSRERRQLRTPPRSRLLALLLGPSSEEKRLLARERSWATGARGEELVADSLARRRPLFGAPKLKIAGRDKTKLIDGLARQVAAVETILADIAPDVPVRGCLCFVAPGGFLMDSGLPLLRTLKVNGYPLYHPRRLAKKLNRSGQLTRGQASEVHAALVARLRPA
jgi:hypothetical protein